jgi:general secretion pathway protein G
MTKPKRKRKLLFLLALLSVAILGAMLIVYHEADQTRREAILQTGLHTMRDVLGQYYQDRGRYPERLEDLVEAGYLRSLPRDPFTESRDTWKAVYAQQGGVVDVHPGPRPGTVERLVNRWRNVLG